MNHEENGTEQWDEVLEDYFNVKMSDRKAERWWEKLKTKVYKLTNDDMCAAIEWMAESSSRSNYQGKPTLDELAKWVKMKRWNDKTLEEKEIIHDEYHATLMSLVRTACMTARTANEVWNRIVEPEHHMQGIKRTTTSIECRELLDWAESTINFDRNNVNIEPVDLASLLIAGTAPSRNDPEIYDDVDYEAEQVAAI